MFNNKLRISINESEDFSPEAISLLSSICQVDFNPGTHTEVLFVRLGFFVGREFLSHLPNLKFIISPTTGTTHLDLSFIRSQGITLFTLRDCMNEIKAIRSTSEFTILLIFWIL